MKPLRKLLKTTQALADVIVTHSYVQADDALDPSLELLKDLIELQTVIVDREYEAHVKYGPLQSKYHSELRNLKSLRDALARKYKSSLKNQNPSGS